MSQSVRPAGQSVRHNTNANDERSTASQLKFLEALIQRLETRGFAGELWYNAKFAIPTYAERGSGYCLRQPDFALPRHGIIIEDDGSAHDDLGKRRKLDISRESNWSGLGYPAVLRFDSQDVYSPTRLTQLLNDIERLIDEAEAKPDFNQGYARRRTAAHRARAAYIKINPDRDLGLFRQDSPAKMSGLFSAKTAHKRWGGLAFVFSSRKPKRRAQAA